MENRIETIELLLKYKFKHHKELSAALEGEVYVKNYNSIRHWIELTDTTVRLYGIEEGTDRLDTVHDTGTIHHNVTLLDKLLSELLIANPSEDAQT